MQKEKHLGSIEPSRNVPKLRFPEFKDRWRFKKIGDLTTVTAGGTPSTLKKEYWNGNIPWMNSGELNLKRVSEVKNRITELGLKKSSTKIIPVNSILIGLAGQGKTRGTAAINLIKLCINQSIAAIYPNTNLFYHEFLFQNIDSRYEELRNLSTGAGGRGGLNLSIIKSIKVPIPNLPEQQKIAQFLTAIDTRIKTLEKKKTLLEQYKKGVMQKIFKQVIRFKDDDGKEFPAWEKRKYADVLFEHKLKSTGKEEVHSVSVHKGVINQIEHLGRSFSASNTDHYSRVLPNDIIYTKSPTGDFPLGIIKQSHIKEDVIVSPLYGVFTPETKELGYILHVYFESPINTSNYLSSIIQKGAKNTISITNTTFLSKKMLLPVSKKEQTKIANFLSAIDKKIALTNQQIEYTKTYKKGLLQQMFV